MSCRPLLRIAFTFVFTLAALSFCASAAYADTDEELLDRIEQTGQEYDTATQRVAELETQISENEKKITELEQQLPELQEACDDAITEMYKQQVNGSTFFKLLLGAENFSDFLAQLDYMNRIEEDNIDKVNQAIEAQQQLNDTSADLEAQRSEAAEQQQIAQEALEDAKAAREEALAQAAAQAAKEAEEARIAAEQAAAAQSAGESASEQTSEGSEQVSQENTETDNGSADSTTDADVAPEGSVSASEVDWSSDKSAFVSQWGPRIDSYLSGSPLSGYGDTFAAAAWDSGVDPRWSPAISCIESSKGRNCARSYNAWGWMNHDFSSWDEGINEHVAYLARVYGSTLTLAAAQKYCPPTANTWYNDVYNEMQKI